MDRRGIPRPGQGRGTAATPPADVGGIGEPTEFMREAC